MGGNSSHPKSKKNPEKDGIAIDALASYWETGDLLALKEREGVGYYFAVLAIPPATLEEPVPPLAIFGPDHPISISTLKSRPVNVKSAMTLMFFQGFTEVLFVKMGLGSKFERLLEIADELRKEGFSPEEQVIINRTPEDNKLALSFHTNAFTLATIYSKLGVPMKPISELTEASLIGHPSLVLNHMEIKGVHAETRVIRPENIPGPISHSKPAPLFSQLIDGIISDHVSAEEHVPLENIAKDLKTGDLILMSGVTNSGAIIKLFDNVPFSHIALVLRSSYTPEIFIWESSTNRANLPDLKTGQAHQGVEILPLKQKIYSGWYSSVAVRQLVGLSEEERKEMEHKIFQFMREMNGIVYETDKVQLILSSLDYMEGKLDLLSNTEEDLSSLFCSEAIAALYQQAGLLDKEKVSNTYSVRDFHSKFHLQLLKGALEKEIYLKLKL